MTSLDVGLAHLRTAASHVRSVASHVSERWKRFDAGRQAKAKAQLERIRKSLVEATGREKRLQEELAMAEQEGRDRLAEAARRGCRVIQRTARPGGIEDELSGLQKKMGEMIRNKTWHNSQEARRYGELLEAKTASENRGRAA